MGGWVTLLFSRNWKNILNQLHFNEKELQPHWTLRKKSGKFQLRSILKIACPIVLYLVENKKSLRNPLSQEESKVYDN